MKYALDGKVYNTKTSKLLQGSEFSDGTNRMSGGRATYLYRTAKGAFFSENRTCWQGERNTAEALTPAEAAELFLSMRGDPDEYADIFGDTLPEA